MFEQVVRVQLAVDVSSAQRLEGLVAAESWAYEWASSSGKISQLHEISSDDQQQHLVVEIPVIGSRWGAVQAAVSQLEYKAGCAGLDVQPVLAEPLRKQDDNTPIRRYRVYRATSRAEGQRLARLKQLSKTLGFRDTGTSIFARTLEEAKLVLESGSRLTSSAVDPNLDVRRPLGTSPDDASSRPPRHLLFKYRFWASLPYLVGAVFSTLSGTLLASGSPTWALVFAVLSILTMVAAVLRGRVLVPALSSFARLSLFLLIGCFCGFAGWWWVSQKRDLIDLLINLLGGVVFLCVLGGITFLFYQSSLRRALPWLIPLVLPVIVSLTGLFGWLTYRAYLNEFGMDPQQVTLSTFDRLVAAAPSLILLLMIYSLLLGIGGWLRYYYLYQESGSFNVVMGGLSTLVFTIYFCVAMLFAIDYGRESARQAQEAALDGRSIEAFFGIDPQRVCLEPLGAEIPAVGGTILIDEPMILMGTADARAALWNPIDKSSVYVALDDVKLFRVADVGGGCSS